MMRALSQILASLVKWVLLRLFRSCSGELAESRVSATRRIDEAFSSTKQTNPRFSTIVQIPSKSYL
jgi:hypothetical protein